MNMILRTMLISLLSLQLAACVSSAGYSPLLSAEPEIGGDLTRAPRTLRLFFDALPDVSRSSLKLIGPNGEHRLRGMHSMAADDLMVEIMDAVTDGSYIVEWVTVVGDDPVVYTGSFNFTYTSSQ